MSVLKATIMDEGTLHRTVRRISYEIVEKNKGTENICLVGIKRRGEMCIRDRALPHTIYYINYVYLDRIASLHLTIYISLPDLLPLTF